MKHGAHLTTKRHKLYIGRSWHSLMHFKGENSINNSVVCVFVDRRDTAATASSGCQFRGRRLDFGR